MDNLETYQILTSSSVGAIITSIIVTPLDVIKTRLQVHPLKRFIKSNFTTQKRHLPVPEGECIIYCNGIMDHVCHCIQGNCKVANFEIPWFKGSNHLNGSADVFQKIVRTEGVFSLWSGLSPTLIMAIPQVVIYYTLNDWLKSITGYKIFQKGSVSNIYRNENKLTIHDLIPPICGGISRIVSQSVVAPLELIRTKMQSKKLSYRQMRSIMYLAFQQDGLCAFWRGMGPTMCRDVPYTVCMWFIYEYLKKRHFRAIGSETQDVILPHSLTFVYSACGAIVAGIVSHPFDVTKTHRQAGLGDAIVHNQKATSTWAYVKSLRANYGYSALFAGFCPRILRVVVATSTMVTIFESMKTFFVYYNKQKSIPTDMVYQ